MHFSFLALASSLSLLSLVSAVPQPQATTPPSTVTPPDRYYLKTKVIDGGDKTKDGFYVTSYHTGAGLDDAVLEVTTEHAAKGFLNATYQQFDFNTRDPVSINTGQQTVGFYFNETGLQWDYAEDGFAGWIVCDWWHGLPQLFWKYNFYEYLLPCSCAQVELHPVAV
ncbi:MAG: hypothetical protein OHK93_008431 [Ramalina farinacea]|uniref:DUF7907 domain-containing protein n=1 Tax=Ramalina farinacea TaxID=258253 RepID=A0AA43TV32_9LECA|nr:hypothetical protein [Ramalina farinacea]